ncbi:3-deoxy-manno-octulosonate cytidylyltransferase [Thioclava sp. SK-1]|uniref:3-deoxy-manno-octulosonate cytidylyltransferase family protein n=1 Tax=Thioclava sp. SK-1 TaxID=1889770 RepID=UPI00082448B0|nr:manno-octulosonate cytidylyltransferase [Thioclava sp. SK-1]OCX65410.1 3-deoxy-manno-octulosonate cytidylyltransferase [Thioclava sp. SK-1]
MSILIVIPARYASTRYPGKPLVELTGASGVKKTLIERSWDAAMQVKGDLRVVVATDDDRIRTACEAFGAEVVMTSEACANGTERCAQAHRILGGGFDYIVNLQGDAPLTPPWFIEALIDGIKGSDADLATPVLRCEGAMLDALKEDRRNGRVGGTTAVFGAQNQALYFSKEVVPFTADSYAPEAPTPVFHHVGAYAYRAASLAQYPDWATGPLETLEGLEQLRFLENQHSVLCVEVEARGRQFWELNNPSDVERIETMMAQMALD